MSEIEPRRKPLNNLVKKRDTTTLMDFYDDLSALWEKFRPARDHALNITVSIRYEHLDGEGNLIHKKVSQSFVKIK